MAKVSRKKVKKPECLQKFLKNKKWKDDWHGKREEILKSLLKMTDFYCPFSGFYGGFTDFEIEHFKPKKKYPELCFEWKNLFPIKSFNNKIKSNRWNKKILKPDKEDYTHFIEYDSTSGKSVPNPTLNSIDQERAEITIKYYGLNKPNFISDIRKFKGDFEKIKNFSDINFSYKMWFVF